MSIFTPFAFYGSSEAGWTPAELDGAVLWFTSNLGVEISSNSALSWTDQIEGFKITTSGSVTAPDYISSEPLANNQPAIACNTGSTQTQGFVTYLTSSYWTQADNAAIYMTFIAESGSDQINTIGGFLNGNGADAFELQLWNGQAGSPNEFLGYAYVFDGGTIRTSKVADPNLSTPLGNISVAALGYQSNNGALKLYLNSTSSVATTTTTGSAEKDLISIGCGVYDQTAAFSSRIKMLDMVYVNGTVIETELAQYLEYVQDKYTPTYDSDAQAFFTAVEGGGDTLTSLEKLAVNKLVLDLKAASLWTTFDAFYPFVGGTSTSCKWNLLDPQDTDAAFRVTWVGGMTFSSTGVLGNSTNSGGNTYLVSNTLGYTQQCMGVYINAGLTPTPNADYDLGAFDGDDTMISLGYNNKTTKYVNFFTTGYKTTSGGSYAKGMLLGQNNGSTSQLYQGTTQLISTAQSYATQTVAVGIGCSWRGSAADPTARGYGTAFIGGTYLNSTQIGDLNTAIVNFNATLSRS